MHKTFAVARPYMTRFRKRVFGFLGELGFELANAGILAAGTPDNVAAYWAARQEVDLLLLPFHVHRTSDGVAVDGVGIALLLPARFDTETSPILMPVSKYSWEASYERRMNTLKEARPLLARRILPLQEHEVGSIGIAKTLGARRGTGAWMKAPVSAPGLKGFPTTSAMSGSFSAVMMDSAPPSSASKSAADDTPSASWRTGASSERGAEEQPSASWKTTRKDDSPSASWPTARGADTRASDSPTSGERSKTPLSDPGRSYQQALRDTKRK